ncbi:hypothetical protein K1719_026456 [Acacia pycnantha]|nr:hypothetical protein K1719_026456 [Acacia pycnantha]
MFDYLSDTCGELTMTSESTNWVDIEALKQLKNGLHNASLNPGSCVPSWNFSVNPCHNLFSEKFTFGFRCDAVISRSSRVTEITIDQGGLRRLTSLNGLKSLERLELQFNNLKGEIPDLGSLENIYYLDLSDNVVTGGIPATLPKSLLQISMRNNSLSRGLRSE